MKKKILMIFLIVIVAIILVLLLLPKGGRPTLEEFLDIQDNSVVDENSVITDNKFAELSGSFELAVLYQGEDCNTDLNVLLNAGNEVVARSALHSIERNFKSFEVINDYYSQDGIYTVEFRADSQEYVLIQSMDSLYNTILTNN